MKCNVCNRGDLIEEEMINDEAEYLGFRGTVRMWGLKCSFCGNIRLTREHAVKNKNAIVGFQEEVKSKINDVSITELDGMTFLDIVTYNGAHYIPVDQDILDKLEMTIFAYNQDKRKGTN